MGLSGVWCLTFPASTAPLPPPTTTSQQRNFLTACAACQPTPHRASYDDVYVQTARSYLHHLVLSLGCHVTRRPAEPACHPYRGDTRRAVLVIGAGRGLITFSESADSPERWLRHLCSGVARPIITSASAFSSRRRRAPRHESHPSPDGHAGDLSASIYPGSRTPPGPAC